MAPTDPSLINLNDATPAAPSGSSNVKWQAGSPTSGSITINGVTFTVDMRDVSAYVPNASRTEVALAPTDGGNFTVAHGLGPSVTPSYVLIQMTSGGAIWFPDREVRRNKSLPRRFGRGHNGIRGGFRMRKSTMIFLCLLASPLFAQQPQSRTAPDYAVSARYVQGASAGGYRPTFGAGLVLNIGPGTAQCPAGTIITYAGGTLTLTASNTNYVYLNAASSCVPAFNTTGFAAGNIPIAVVVAGSSTLTSMTDDRTQFISSTALPTQYTKLRCFGGLGDGDNAMIAATYPQYTCVNTSGVTWTITGINCWTDNAGSSTMDVKNNAGTSFLTGAVTCNNTKSGGGAAGTQSATVTLANNDALNFSFVADGTSKQTNWTVSMTQ